MTTTELPGLQPNPRFVTKQRLAQRYHVSTRTISNWNAAGLLVGFKIRRVVRFDVQACDEALARTAAYWISCFQMKPSQTGTRSKNASARNRLNRWFDFA